MFREKCREFGIVLKPHGVKGELMIKTAFQLPDHFELTESIFFEIEGLLVPFFIEEYTISSSETVIIKLEGLSDKNKSIRFIDCKVFIEKTKKNSAGKTPFDALSFIGFSVINQDRQKLGLVNNIMDIPGNFLLSVLHGESEILIPFNEELLINIDKKKKLIQLKIHPGLLDLNK